MVHWGGYEIEIPIPWRRFLQSGNQAEKTTANVAANRIHRLPWEVKGVRPTTLWAAIEALQTTLRGYATTRIYMKCSKTSPEPTNWQRFLRQWIPDVRVCYYDNVATPIPSSDQWPVEETRRYYDRIQVQWPGHRHKGARDNQSDHTEHCEATECVTLVMHYAPGDGCDGEHQPTIERLA